MFNSSSSRFQPTHLVLKNPTEHTIDGHHFDLEMVIYHKNTNGTNEAKIDYAATVLMFSVEEFDPIDEAYNKTL